MPVGGCDNFVFAAVIAHFTPAPMGELLRRLTQGGLLSGHTVVWRKDGPKSLTHHEYAFRDKAAPHAVLYAASSDGYRGRNVWSREFRAPEGPISVDETWAGLCRHEWSPP